jgi:hypothetical protein
MEGPLTIDIQKTRVRRPLDNGSIVATVEVLRVIARLRPSKSAEDICPLAPHFYWEIVYNNAE